MSENSDCNSLGDVDPSGEIVTREEGLRYCREALSTLSGAVRALTPDTGTEYSRWLVEQHDRWLQALRDGEHPARPRA
jgi:hypothetical protein